MVLYVSILESLITGFNRTVVNRVKQTFGLYSEQNGMLHEEKKSIAYKDLGQVLDTVIETGGMSQQEHLQRLREYAKRLLA